MSWCPPPSLVWYAFHPLRCRRSAFIVRSGRLTRPEAPLEGCINFSRVPFVARCPPPLCSPPHSAFSDSLSLTIWLRIFYLLRFYGCGQLSSCKTASDMGSFVSLMAQHRPRGVAKSDGSSRAGVTPQVVRKDEQVPREQGGTSKPFRYSGGL